MTLPVDIRKPGSLEDFSLSASSPNRFGWRDRSGSGHSAASFNSDPGSRKSGHRSDSLHSIFSEDAFPFSRLSTLSEEALNFEDDQNQGSSFEQIEQQTRVIRRASGVEEETTTMTRTIRKVSSLSGQYYSPSLSKRSPGEPFCPGLIDKEKKSIGLQKVSSSSAPQSRPAAVPLRLTLAPSSLPPLDAGREEVRTFPLTRRSSLDNSIGLRRNWNRNRSSQTVV